ncbi:hypothetical protein [Halioglobus japonicus]|uniref:hypothetical protein n=1 Tax=Halioglobus japonicus TaxID=930805 RepID=UPI0011AFAC67|nr:hypothetical protein [Halioglobus japonicus]
MDSNGFTAQLNSNKLVNNARLSVAILGFGLETPVRAGENRGEQLEHEFVVLGFVSYQGNGRWQGTLPEAPLREEATRLGIAAWVSGSDAQRPLQAAGGWLN